jgi:type IV pilus assembly protein PilW
MKIKQAASNQGFTLVETLISMLISTIIIGVALTQLLGSRVLFAQQEANSRIDENARYALDFLTKNIRKAGYVDTGPSSNQDLPKGQFFDEGCGSITNNDTVFNPCTNNAAGTASDHIAVWTNPHSSQEQTCSGINLTDANTSIANLFYLASEQLRCRSYSINDNTNTATYISDSDIEIIDGIHNMQILYGLTDRSFSNSIPIRYISAATINAIADEYSKKSAWSSVVSVRIILLVGTGINDGQDSRATRTYTLGDADSKEYTDGNLRRVFSSTVALNNAIF